MPADDGVVGRGHRGQPRAAGRPDRRRRAARPSSCGRPATAVLTSATIPPALPDRLGLAAGGFDALDVGSPFDYASQRACSTAPPTCPTPARPAFEPAVHDELEALIAAAGGRTLALFTSYRAMQAAAEALRPRLPWPLLTQDDLPKPALIAALHRRRRDAACSPPWASGRASTCPAPSLSLVTIDRLPVPPARRAAAAGPPRAGPRRRLPPRRPAPGHHAARPGRRPPHPLHHRPRRRRGARPPPGHQRPLPLGHRPRAAADAPHPRPGRGRGVPPLARRPTDATGAVDRPTARRASGRGAPATTLGVDAPGGLHDLVPTRDGHRRRAGWLPCRAARASRKPGEAHARLLGDAGATTSWLSAVR